MSAQSRFQIWDKRFGRLKNTERRLIICASVLCLVVLMYVFAIEPAIMYKATRGDEVKGQRTELDVLQKDVSALQEKLRDPEAPNRMQLEALMSNLAKLDADLKHYDALLVPPERMTELLRNLLNKYPGLKLVRLKTKPPAPVAGRIGSMVREAAGASKAPVPTSMASMYRHDMEITLSGSYADLLAYAEELQRISPRPLWSALQLKVVEYPRSELTFVLYTLSLDPTWLAV